MRTILVVVLGVVAAASAAIVLNLVLLGGHTGAEVEGHDWEHILQILGLLHRDILIARLVHSLGALLMIGALVWGTVIAWKGEPE